jgi:L-threonylcarbamoyladenylate synthase
MEILRLYPENAEQIALKTAKILMGGGVCVCPTDTVYGLLANALTSKAVKKIYRIKKRDPGKPLPVFIKSIEAAKKIAVIDGRDEDKLQAAWPGKTTFVLNLRSGVNIPATTGRTIALRMPDHEFLSALLEKLDFPVIGTSANIAGHGPFNKINDILTEFSNAEGQPDLVINAGNLPKSKPSTIVDLTDNAKILRK